VHGYPQETRRGHPVRLDFNIRTKEWEFSAPNWLMD
jgi:hypothetical protein